MPKPQRTVTSLPDLLAQKLTQKERKRIHQSITVDMLRKHRLLSDLKDGFFYEGIFYTDIESYPHVKMKKTTLHPSLVPEMMEIVHVYSIVKNDMKRISMGLALVLKNCKDWQDIRDALPEGMVDLMDQTKHLKRLSEEAWTLKDDPKKLEQYMKIKPLIDQYIGMRLIT